MLLRLLERWGTSSWSPVIRSVRRPLVLGFGLALFLNGSCVFPRSQSFVSPSALARSTTSIVLIVIGRAHIVGGLKFLHSAAFNSWLMREIENERERAMMVSLLDRIYSIVIVLVTFAAIMVANQIVSLTAVGAVLWDLMALNRFWHTADFPELSLRSDVVLQPSFAERGLIKVSTFEGNGRADGWLAHVWTFDQKPPVYSQLIVCYDAD